MANRPTTIWQRLHHRGTWRWAKRGALMLLLVALFADFLASDKPLVGRHQGQLYFPAARQALVDLGWGTWPAALTPWYKQKEAFDWQFLPPVPYGPTQKNVYDSYLSPTGEQPVDGWRYRHWLGTDSNGQDVLAQLIHGTRTALGVGLGAITIALLIGLLLGSWAGFFGDTNWRISQSRWLGGLVGLLIGMYYGFVARSYLLALDQHGNYWSFALVILWGATVLGALLGHYLLPRSWRHTFWAIPFDSLVMRIIEIITAIPALLLLLALLASVGEKSLLLTTLILGLLLWTSIARFVRGELLQVRSLEYIQAAQVTGVGPVRRLLRHALPNALQPVYTAAAFGIAAAILTEAGLSLLGLGLPSDTPSWGRLLSEANFAPSAWWLAIFPGVAIFLAVSIFNFLGEGIGKT
ncbi:MAG: ABC transporter permease subunit [Bacteroidota bacterium]